MYFTKNKKYFINITNSSKFNSTPIIYFLKKERAYTKLKYSRVPMYDSVSGGLASFVAGFLGFLISERFGYELVDSGDLYYLYMYVIMFIAGLRLYFISYINFNNKTYKFLYLPIYVYITNLKNIWKV